jgi:hypothetical protein
MVSTPEDCPSYVRSCEQAESDGLSCRVLNEWHFTSVSAVNRVNLVGAQCPEHLHACCLKFPWFIYGATNECAGVNFVKTPHLVVVVDIYIRGCCPSHLFVDSTSVPASTPSALSLLLMRLLLACLFSSERAHSWAHRAEARQL